MYRSYGWKTDFSLAIFSFSMIDFRHVSNIAEGVFGTHQNPIHNIRSHSRNNKAMPCHAMPSHTKPHHITPNITHSYDLSLSVYLYACSLFFINVLSFVSRLFADTDFFAWTRKGDTKSQHTQKHYFSSSEFRCSSKLLIFLFPLLNDANNN